MSGFYSPERYAMRRQRRADIKRSLGQAFGLARRVIPGGVSMVGLGDYQIKYNSLMGGGEGSGSTDYVPSLSNTGSRGSVRIQHREYLQDVNSSTSFVNTPFVLNPSNSACFPWLSNMALNFQEYKFHGLVFHYVSLSAEALNSTNTALGAVIMSTDYNAASKPYASKAAAENSEYTVSTKPSCSLVHGIECDPMMTVNQGHLYISPYANGTAPTGEDPKTYNMGTFQFMTQGSQAVANIGELWVSYDVELIKPIDNSIINRSAVDHFQLVNVAPSVSSAGYLFGSSNLVKVNTVGGSITTSNATTSTYTFPLTAVPGQVYLITYNTIGVATTITAPTIATTYLTFNTIFDNDQYYNVYSNGTSSTTFIFLFCVTIGPGATNGVQATIGFSTPGAVPSSSTGDLIVTQVPAALIV